MATLKGFITNLSLYNEGKLVGERIEFPIDDESLDEVKKRIQIDENHEEYFFTDYECDDLSNFKASDIPENCSVDELNSFGERISDVDDYLLDAALDQLYLDDALSAVENNKIVYCGDEANYSGCEREFFKKKDSKALNDKLNELQERCKERLLSVDDCIFRLKKVDSFLNISNKAMTGTKVIVHADMQKLPRCYRYVANSTKAVFIYDGRHWCFMSAFRDRMLQKGIGYHCEIELSDTAKSAILKRYNLY